MSARDKKVVLLVLLIGVAGAVVWRQWDSGGAGSGTRVSTNDTPIIEGRRIDKIGGEGSVLSDGRDVFSFGRRPAAPPPPQNPRFPEPPPLPPDDDREPKGPEGGTPPPPVPPTPQPIPLLYTGFARDSSDRMIAFLETTGGSAPVGHYNLKEKDFLLGRYRINRSTPASVEVEDVDRAETAPDRRRAIRISPAIAAKP